MTGPVPTGEAVALFDWFLTELAALHIPCLAVAGNHDSGVRLSFAGQLLRQNEVYLVGTVTEQLIHVPFRREGLTVEIWMLPFLRPAEVAVLFPEEEICSYDDAVRAVLSRAAAGTGGCAIYCWPISLSPGGQGAAAL